MKKHIAGIGALLAVLLTMLALPGSSIAHCDSMDGPVVVEAQRALASGDVTPLLKWVKAEYETELRTAFDKARAVRGQNPEVREIADLYFLETLVRVHRAGEGAPYTGLKPAGQQEAIIVDADRALTSSSAAELMDEMAAELRDGVQKRFEHAVHAKQYSEQNIEAGRQFVAAYVEYIHYIEALHGTMAGHSAHRDEASNTIAPPCGRH